MLKQKYDDFVTMHNAHKPRLRRMVGTAAFLDAVNVAAAALMSAVTVELGRETLINWRAWAIAGLAALLTFLFKLSSDWLVVDGVLLGYVLNL